MELFVNQVLAGISTGAIYACMALAVVMIYQAIDHLNFAQGEMAMFSTFISWQLMQWGVPYWWAFLLTLAISFAGGIVIERLLFKPLAKAPVLTNVAGFIALFAIVNSVAGLTWDFTIKQYPSPFGSAPFLGSQLISTHQAGMIGVTVLMLIGLYGFFQFTRIGLAMRAAAALPESARLVGINTSWMIALGWGMATAIGAVARAVHLRANHPDLHRQQARDLKREARADWGAFLAMERIQRQHDEAFREAALGRGLMAGVTG